MWQFYIKIIEGKQREAVHWREQCAASFGSGNLLDQDLIIHEEFLKYPKERIVI